MSNLRIIADDLGLARSVNEGIILALKNKWIDGASLMPNGEAFLDAVEKVKSVPDAMLGVHIVLVEERSLAEPKDIPTLANTERLMPKDHQVFFLKYIAGLIRRADIEKEVRLQIKVCTDHGIQPQFINSHQHLHLLPGITKIFIKLAREFNIPYVRIVAEPLTDSSGSIFRKIESLVLRFLSGIAKRKIERDGLSTNDLFLGFGCAGNMQLGDIHQARNLAAQHPARSIELGCHPGYDDPQVAAHYRKWGVYHWKQELEALELSARL